MNKAISPGGSAGLAVISRFRNQVITSPSNARLRFPFLEVEPMFFVSCVRGHLAALDGEILSRKGALRVKIKFNGHTVDIVNTHLIGESLDGEKERDTNEYHRQGQTKELLKFIERSCSDSDLVVLGGDFNFEETDVSHHLVTGANFKDTGAGEGADRSTWGHPENTMGNSPPHLLDYVFVKTNKEQVEVEAKSFIPERAFQ